MKTCSKCNTPKDSSEFSFCAQRPDKLQSYCKPCASVARKASYQENSEHERECRIAHYKENREHELEYGAEYYKENKEHIKEYNAAYRKENREELNRKSREGHSKNRPAINKRKKLRYDSDPLYKLATLLRSRVRLALAGKNKSAKTVELLGAPLVWVEAYLEEQFQPGMSWENHGPVWHIDHIRPIASFDLTDPEQQKICFHWSNMQPLFALDNFRKSDFYDPQTA